MGGGEEWEEGGDRMTYEGESRLGLRLGDRLGGRRGVGEDRLVICGLGLAVYIWGQGGDARL